MVVILSGETASRREAVLESKDPYERIGVWSCDFFDD
jgi:hypothetical protein